MTLYEYFQELAESNLEELKKPIAILKANCKTAAMKENETINYSPEEMLQLAHDFRDGKIWSDRLMNGRGILSFGYPLETQTPEQAEYLGKATEAWVDEKGVKWTGSIYELVSKATKYKYEGCPIFDSFKIITAKEMSELNATLLMLKETVGPSEYEKQQYELRQAHANAVKEALNETVIENNTNIQ